jgi:tellurite resistance protein TerC
MIWFWLGYFSLVALLLFLDLFVFHRKNEEQSLKSAAAWTAGWMSLGLSFTGVVYLMFENKWLGISGPPGGEAAITYLSAYLLEQALSVDNIFVISLLFHTFRVPMKYQHRVLFWGIMGAIVFRVGMLAGGVWLAQKFDWIFYIFGAYLAWQGFGLLREDESDEEEDALKNNRAIRFVRRFVKVIDGDHGGKFVVKVDGRIALTTVAVCLISVELTDIVFALDSIPAVLSVSQETFIIITSNIFAIMGLRALYFVLAGAMAQFKYLKLALAVLLMGIGVKLFLHNHVHVSHVISLIAIASIISSGVIASIISSKRNPPSEPPLGSDHPHL